MKHIKHDKPWPSFYIGVIDRDFDSFDDRTLADLTGARPHVLDEDFEVAKVLERWKDRSFR